MSGNEATAWSSGSVSGINAEIISTEDTNTYNINRNGRQQYRGGDQYNTPNFKFNIEGLSTLGVKEEKRMDYFMVLQKEVH